MLEVHQVLARAVVYVLLLLGIWGVGAGLVKRPVGGAYRSTYILAVGLVLVQDLAGVVLFIAGQRPGQMLHLLYGVALPAIMVGAYSYTPGATARREAFTLGLASLIMFIMVITRAIPTGAP
ncbi:MAG TPA: hypothetical protein VMV93_13725 [Chloroflexota bacterium]|nr:hypothetical protein [Chloroflexota bacterium]